MPRLSLAVLLLTSLALACAQPKPAAEPRPDYDGAKSRSDRSHGALDKETAD